ncbi:MAG: hypothetical protein A2X86_12955 [Bdellovibrionales bacterium GWA2_49_15]|nr:MAG: hypothetical protein A2X86_12955 [Bdellovibrionales bacterium GWA2_49_15]HAZ13894.1 hypothetical protein [Bdellovibrionales bacterium]
MKAAALKLPVMNNVLPRSRVFEICQHLIRKDLEIFSIQNRMVEICEEFDYYSCRHDEYLNIDFALELAFGKRVDELDERIVTIVDEIALHAASYYWKRKVQCDEGEYLSHTAKKITEMIFAAALEPHPSLGAFKCIELHLKNFSNLEIPYVTNLHRQILLRLKGDDSAPNLTTEERCAGSGGSGGGPRVFLGGEMGGGGDRSGGGRKQIREIG